MRGLNPMLAFLLGAAIVGLGVLGYILYERQNRQVLKIDVPGFSGEITKDKGVDIEVAAGSRPAANAPSFRRKPNRWAPTPSAGP